MFPATNSLDPGTGEYNEVFEVAPPSLPENKTANLNAAMGRKDYMTAEKYLQKAGSVPVALDALEQIEILKKNLEC